MNETRIAGDVTLRLCGCALVLLFLASAFTPLPNLLAKEGSISSKLEPADAIVVLAGGMYLDGVLGDGSLRRALVGVTLYRKGLARLLVLSGPAVETGPSEAAIRLILAQDLGIPAEMVVTEEKALTTREEAARVGALLQVRGIRRILLVTDSLHMWRAQKLFERIGFEVFPADADDFPLAAAGPGERLYLMYRVIREMAARVYYRIAGYV